MTSETETQIPQLIFMKKQRFWAFLAVAFVAAMIWFLSFQPQSEQEKQIIGSKETIKIITPDGKREVVAKIDTGADSSSIDEKLAKDLGMEIDESEQRVIVSIRGRQIRDTVNMSFVLGGSTISTRASVADRSRLGTDVLIGRNSLQGFIVDPSKEFLTTPAKESAISLAGASIKRTLAREDFAEILIIPILGALVVLLRILAGVKTFGIFAPTVIALSLLEADIWQRLGIYVALLVLGFGFRALFLKRMRLPQIAEMSILMFFLVISIVALAELIFNYSISALSIFFPLIITTHLIERFSRTVEDHREKEAWPLLANTLIVATALGFIGQLLLTQPAPRVWVIFTAMLLAVIWVSGYTGIRLSELFRFKSLIKNGSGN